MSIKKAFLLLMMLSLSTVVGISLVNATDTTVSLLADQDSYIDAVAPNSNDGSSTALYVKSYDAEQQRTLLQFDLSSIPSGVSISSATLELYYAVRGAESLSGRTFWAYQVTQSWTELGVTWGTYDGTSSWVTAGGDYTETGGASLTMPSSHPTYVQWDVTDIVTAWVEGGEPNYGFLIKDSDETQNEAVYYALFRSSEYTNQPDRNPILEITYTVSASATIESCDNSGTAKDEFTIGDDVYVVGSGFASSTSYDLKIVIDVDWVDGMTIPSGIAGTTVSSDASGNIGSTLGWSGATLGKYDIIVDVNGNGEYDEGIDALDDIDVGTAGFQVIPEYGFGTIMGATLCFAAFVTYYLPKRKSIHQ